MWYTGIKHNLAASPGTGPKGLYPISRHFIKGKNHLRRLRRHDPEGTSAPDTMCTVAQQAKLLHRINRRSLFLTVQASIRCRCTAHNQGIGAVPEDMLSKPRLWIQTSALPAKLQGRAPAVNLIERSFFDASGQFPSAFASGEPSPALT